MQRTIIKSQGQSNHQKKKKDQIFVTFQEKYRKQILTFKNNILTNYLHILGNHSVVRCNSTKIKNYRMTTKLVKSEIGRSFSKILLRLRFFENNEIDCVSETIKLDHPNIEQASKFFSKELFILL